uniref:RNA-directed DNA polymerase n=4 Tax=Lygus hesperus TaxID=30085 RepID=A0A146KXW0_LYGHE
MPDDPIEVLNTTMRALQALLVSQNEALAASNARADALQAGALAVAERPPRAASDLPRSLFLEIETWDPEEVGALPVATFLRTVDGVAKDLDQNQKLRLLRTRLKGAAKRFVQDNPPLTTSETPYDDVRKEMLRWFDKDDPEKAAVRLWTMKRLSTESIRHFAERILQTAQRAVETEEDEGTEEEKQRWIRKRSMRAFIKGLNTELSVHLVNNPPAELEDALKRAEEVEETLETQPDTGLRWEVAGVMAGDPRKCYNCGDTSHFAARCPQRLPPTATRNPPRTPQGARSNIRVLPRFPCLYCGMMTHFPVDCPSNIRATIFCDFCGAREHLERDCFRKRRTMPVSNPTGRREEPPATLEELELGATAVRAVQNDSEKEDIEEDGGERRCVVAVRRSHCTLLKVTALLDGRTRDLVVDTGAAVSVLSSPIDGVPVKPTRAQVWGADGQDLPLLGLQTVMVRIGTTQCRHTFHVFKRPDAGLDLLGMDLMAKLPMTVRTDRGEAKMEDPATGAMKIISFVVPGPRPPRLHFPGEVPMRPTETTADEVPAQPTEATSEEMPEPPTETTPEGVPVRPEETTSKEALVRSPNTASMQNDRWWAQEEVVLPRAEWLIDLPTIGRVEASQVKEVDDTFPPEQWDKNEQQSIQSQMMARVEHLPEAQRSQVEELLETFTTLFERPTGNGCTLDVSHVIDTGSEGPAARRPYPIPHALRPIVEEQVQLMLDDGVIRPSQSPWCAPVVMVKKKTTPGQPTEWRFCTDYRDLNRITKSDAYPLPRLQETVSLLGQSRYYSTLDLTMGYHQIRVHPESREKTAFTVLGRHYEYERMAFGLKNAPATFQRAMHTVLQGMVGVDCLVYLDDVIVFSADFDTHMDKLRRVLQRFQDAGFRVNLKKCAFLQQEVRFLGHLVTTDGVRMEPEKVAAVRDYPTPKDVKGVQAFLGLAGFYRRFISHYSAMAVPLTVLLRKDKQFEWKDPQKQAFQDLKNALQSDAILAYPDFDKEFILATDASGAALGAVLSQKSGEMERPIAFASRVLNPAETRYSTTERELLAVVWATNHFQEYLLGRKFTLETDHAALTATMNIRDPTSRIGRWILRLAEYDYEPRYRPGSKMGHVDGLSRVNIGAVGTFSMPAELLRAAQALDEWIQKLTAPGNERETICQEEGIWVKRILREGETVTVPLIPKLLRNWFLGHCHGGAWAGHPGIETTEKLARRFGFWDGMAQTVAAFVRGCPECQRRNTPNCSAPPLQSSTIAERVGQIVGVDFVGPIHSPTGTRYLLTAVDHLSKYAEAYVVTDCSARTVAEVLARRYIPVHGVPESLVSDRGAAFTSTVVSELCQAWGIRQILTSAYHPQGNGVCERFHRTLANIVSKICKDTNQWERVLPMALAAYRATPHHGTGYTPNALHWGREVRLPNAAALDLREGESQQLLRPLRQAQRIAQEQLRKAAAKRNALINQRRTLKEFSPGQRVYLRQMAPPPNVVRKFWSPWVGPYSVVRQTTPVNYEIRDVTGKLQKVHLMRLKPAFDQDIADEQCVVEKTMPPVKGMKFELREKPEEGELWTTDDESESEDDRPQPPSGSGQQGADPGVISLQEVGVADTNPRYGLRPRKEVNYRKMHQGK